MTDNSIHRIGVLTGGGDCPGLNAVLRAVVKSAANLHSWEVRGIEDGFDGLLDEPRTRMLGLADVRGLLARGGTILGTTNRANPFAYRPDGAAQPIDLSDRLVENLEQLGIDAPIVIGGEGTLAIAQEFTAMWVRMVGVPKTIAADP